MKLKATLFLPCFGMLLSLGATGCGRFKRPSTVVHSLYMDCQNGEYPKARNLFIKDIRENFDGALAFDGPGIKGVCDRLTRSGTLEGVTITDEKIVGDRAVVVTDLQFENNIVKQGVQTQLLREDGAWKVSQ